MAKREPNLKPLMIVGACLLLFLFLGAISWPVLKASAVKTSGLEGIMIRGPKGSTVTINGQAYGRTPVRLGADEVTAMIAPLTTITWPGGGFGVTNVEQWQVFEHSTYMHGDGTHVFMIKTPQSQRGMLEVRVQARMGGVNNYHYCSQVGVGYGPPDKRIIYDFD